MRRVTWFLGNGRTIEKEGAGAQAVFATLSPSERMQITLKCERVVEVEITSTSIRIETHEVAKS